MRGSPGATGDIGLPGLAGAPGNRVRQKHYLGLVLKQCQNINTKMLNMFSLFLRKTNAQLLKITHNQKNCHLNVLEYNQCY